MFLVAVSILTSVWWLSRPGEGLVLYVGPPDQSGKQLKVLAPAGWEVDKGNHMASLGIAPLVTLRPPRRMTFLPQWLRRVLGETEEVESCLSVVEVLGDPTVPARIDQADVVCPDGTMIYISHQYEETRHETVVGVDVFPI